MHNLKARKISAGAAVLGLVLLIVGAITTGTRVDAADDTTAPALTAFTRTSPATFTAPGEVNYTFTATDASGIGYVSALFIGREGNFLVSSPGDIANGTLVATITPDTPGGIYQLSSVSVIDNAGNHVSFLRNGDVFVHSAATTTAPATHGLNLSAADFTFDNDNGDVTNPVLTSVTRTTSATVTAPASVSLSYAASDSGVGIGTVQALYVGPGPTGQNQLPSSIGTTATGAVTVTVPAATPPGTYSLLLVRLTDKAVPANDVSYNADQSITKLTAGSTGPATHTLDFAPAAFTVSGGTTSTTATPTTSTTLAGSTSTTAAPTTSTTQSGATTSTTASGGTTSTTASGGPTTSTTAAGGATTSTTGAGGATTSSTTPTAGLTLNASSAAPGGTVGISSSGWKPNSPVQVIFRSDPVVLATLTANASGVVTGNVTIPAAASAGAHTIELVGTGADDRSRTVSAPLTVTAKSSLPRTGANTTMVTWAGLSLLFAGIAGVALGEGPAPAGDRRRRRR